MSMLWKLKDFYFLLGNLSENLYIRCLEFKKFLKDQNFKKIFFIYYCFIICYF